MGGTLQVDGTLTANGTAGGSWYSNGGGGGSGGSVYVTAGTLTGTGTVSANGGSGGNNAGGGGGGRIALYYDVNSFAGTVSVNGGIGYQSGQPGTIHYGVIGAPHITPQTYPLGFVNHPVDRVDLVFSQPIDPATLTPDAVDVLGPDGPIVISSIGFVETVDGRETYRVAFAVQDASGAYQVRVEPTVKGASGVFLDQDLDGTPGEPIDDLYQATFRIDTVAPGSVTSLSFSVDAGASATDGLTSDTEPRFSWIPPLDDSGVGGYEYRLDGGVWTQHASASVTLTLAAGIHSFAVRAVDGAGNVGEATQVGLEIDATLPATVTGVTMVDDTGASGSDGITADGSPTFSWDASSDEKGIWKHQYQLDSGAWVDVAGTTVTLTPGDGLRSFKVRALDNAGNASTASDPLVFRVDTTAPAAPALAMTDDTGTSSADFITTDTTPRLSWSGPNDAGGIWYYQYRLDGAPWTDTTETALDLTLDEGSHAWELRALDLAGNVGTTLSKTLVVDLTAPGTIAGLTFADDLGVSAMDGLTADTSILFSWTAPGDAGGIGIYEYQLDGGAWTTRTTPSVTLTLGEGMHAFAVRAVDKAGNTGEAAQISLEVDATLPATVTGVTMVADTGASASDGVTADSTPTFSWNPSSDAKGIWKHQYQVNSGTWTDADGTTVTLNLSDGLRTFRVRALDNSGNASVPSDAFTFRVDTTPPGVPGLTMTDSQGNPASGFVTTSSDVRLTWTPPSDPGGVWYYQYRLDGNPWTDTADTSLDLTLAEGAHPWELRAVDLAGNIGVTRSESLIVDTAVPGPVVGLQFADDSGVSATDGLTNDTTPTFSWSPPADLSGISGYEYQLDGGVWTARSSTSVTLTVGEGNHLFAVRAVDRAGNKGDVAQIAFEVDATLPATVGGIALAEDTGASADDAITADNTPTFSWSASSDFHDVWKYQYQLDGGTWTDASGTSVSLNLGNGLRTFRVRAVDNAANASLPSDPVTFRIDTAPPSVPGLTMTDDTGISATDFITSDTSPLLSWTAPADASGIWYYQHRIDGGAWTDTAETSFALLLAEGSHTWELRVVDQAGNVGSTLTKTLVIDATPPGQITSLRFLDDNGNSSSDGLTNDTSPTFSWTPPSDAGGIGGYEYQLNGGVWTAITNPFVTLNLSDGSHTFFVRAVDKSGNAGEAAQISLILDATPPAPVTGLGMADDTGSSGTDGITADSTPVFTWNASSDAGGIWKHQYQLNNGPWIDASGTSVALTLGDGLRTLKIRAVDNAGNASVATDAFSFRIDTTPPSAPGLSLADDTGASATDFITSDMTPQLTWTAPNDAGGIWYYQYRLDGDDWTNVAETASDLVLGEGVHAWDLRAVDLAGNVGGILSKTLVIDTTSPSVLGHAAIGTTNVPVQSVDVTFSETMDPATLNDASLSLSGPSGTVAAPGFSASALGAGVYRISFQPQFADGVYRLQITTQVRDVAGNTLESAYELSFEQVLPDLAASFAAAEMPTAARTTEKIAVPVSVSNQGSGFAEQVWFDRLYFSADAVLGGADTLLWEADASGFRPLEPSGQYGWAPEVTIPAVVPGGTYYLLWFTDGRGNVGETNEANNMANWPLEITATSELSLFSLSSSPGDPLPGEDVGITATIRNNGPDLSPATTVQFFILPVPGQTSTLLDEIPVPALIVGQTFQAEVSWNTSSLTTDRAKISAVLDAAGLAVEVNRADNVLESDVRIGRPSLIAHWSLPPEFEAGQQAKAIIELANTGLRDARFTVLDLDLDLPAGVTVVSTTPAANGPNGTWFWDAIQPGAKVATTVTLAIDHSASGTLSLLGSASYSDRVGNAYDPVEATALATLTADHTAPGLLVEITPQRTSGADVQVRVRPDEPLSAPPLISARDALGVAMPSSYDGMDGSDYLFTLTATGAVEGVARVDASGSDVHQNTGLGTGTLLIDRTLPTFAVSIAEKLLGGGTQTLTVTPLEAVAQAPTVALTAADGQTIAVSAAVRSGSSYHYTFTLGVGTAQGEGRFHVQATDLTGNAGTADGSFYVDTIAPTFTATVPELMGVGTYQVVVTPDEILPVLPTVSIRSASGAAVEMWVERADGSVVAASRTAAYDDADGRFEISFDPAAVATPGVYTLALRATGGSFAPAVKRSSIQVIRDFSVTVESDAGVYQRGSPVTISGRATDILGNPLASMSVELRLSAQYGTRLFSLQTDADGRYRMVYAPQPTEAGQYQATATVAQGEISRTSPAADFEIRGLYLQASRTETRINAGESQSLSYAVRNLGTSPLEGLTIMLENLGGAGELTGQLNLVGVPTRLAGGQSTTFKLNLVAGQTLGARAFRITVASSDGSTEMASLSAEVRGTSPVIQFDPPQLETTVRDGSRLTREITVRNVGWYDAEDAALSVNHPAWVSVFGLDPILGTLAGQKGLADEGFGLFDHYSLLGRVGVDGDVFKVGSQLSLTAPQGGQLYFRMNEGDDQLSDNQGTLAVRLLKQGAPLAVERSVAANAGWQPSGVYVVLGQQLQITAAGTWETAEGIARDAAGNGAVQFSVTWAPNDPALANGQPQDWTIVLSGSNISSRTMNLRSWVTAAQQSSAALTVTTPVGEPIPGARVTLYSQQYDPVTRSYPNYTQTTETDGTTAFASLSPGSYGYAIRAAEFVDRSGTFSVGVGEDYAATVPLDPNVVSVEWVVQETTVQDRYDVVLRTVYQVTENAPAPPILLAAPIQHTVRQDGTIQGDLRVRSMGQTMAVNLQLTMPLLGKRALGATIFEGDPDVRIEFLVTDKTGQTTLQPSAVVGVLLPNESVVLRYQITTNAHVPLGSEFKGMISVRYEYSELGSAKAGEAAVPVQIRVPELRDELIVEPGWIVRYRSHTLGIEEAGFAWNELGDIRVTNSSSSLNAVSGIVGPYGLLFNTGVGVTDVLNVLTGGLTEPFSIIGEFLELPNIVNPVVGRIVPEGPDCQLQPGESCTLSFSNLSYSAGFSQDIVSISAGAVAFAATWDTPELSVSARLVPILIVDVAITGQQVTLDWHLPNWSWTPPPVSNPVLYEPPTISFPGIGQPPQIPAEPEPKYVTFEIQQEATFDRQGFQGTLRVHNGSETNPLEDVRVNIEVLDEANQVVSTDHRTFPDLFFTPPELNGLDNVDGEGTLGAKQAGTATWTIIPTPAATGNTYRLRAHVTWTWNGVTQDRYSQPVEITVAPQPHIELQYFIQRKFGADQPFYLGVGARNTGQAAAHNFQVASDQPTIIWEETDVPNASVKIVGGELYKPAEDAVPLSSLNVLMGTLEPGDVGYGWWRLQASPGGQVTEFSANAQHDEALGGERTSLLDISSETIWVMHYGLVNDAPNGSGGTAVLLDRDGDWAADSLLDLRTSRSHEVAIVGDQVLQTPTWEIPELHVSLGATDGWGYAQILDPFAGAGEIIQVRAAGGRVLDPRNYWQEGGFIHLVDYETTEYVLVFDPSTIQPRESELSWRAGETASAEELTEARVGETVYLRVDAPAWAGKTIDLEIWEDDGLWGDDRVTTLAVTINEQGCGVVPWLAEWQTDDEDDPQNTYYIYYDVPWSLSNLESDPLQVQVPPSTAGGVTVITHGWDLFGGVPAVGGLPDWAVSMGQAILDRADGSQTDRSTGCLFKHTPTDGSWLPVADAWNNSASCSPDPVVLLYDWSWESNDTEEGWLEAAADNLFAGLLSGQASLEAQSFFDVAQEGDLLNFHFIGHSRGAVLNSLVVKRFDQSFSDFEIDHVTSLDPHPWSTPPDPGYNERKLFTYDNVRFADNYYRQDGWYQNDLDFDGVPAEGAYNLQLDESVLSGYEDGYPSEHSDVHAWYYGTITAPFADDYAGYSGAGRNVETTGWPLVPNPDFPETWYGTAGVGSRGMVGFNYSRLGDPTSRPTAVDGERIDYAETGGVADVFNGDFSFGDVLFNELPGWERHGGGGTGHLVVDESGNSFLELELNNADPHEVSRTHNPLYVPSDAQQLVFRARVKQRSLDDVFKVLLGDRLIGEFSVAQTSGEFVLRGLPVPDDLRGTVQTITFSLEAPGLCNMADAEVQVDDVDFSAEPIDVSPNDVHGWTVIVHGLADEVPDWEIELVRSIAEQADNEGSAFRYVPGTGELKLLSGNGSTAGYNALAFDWSVEANLLSSPGWAEAAGDALYATLVDIGAAVHDGTGQVLHLMGFSRGASVVSEAARRLLASDYAIDQVTYLDGEDDFYGDPDFRAWEKIGFVDNYYDKPPQTVGGEGPLEGAYNFEVSPAVGHLNFPKKFYLPTLSALIPGPGYPHTALGGAARPDETGLRSPLSDRPSTVFNGDFEVENAGTRFPGWDYHGGGGTGHVQEADGNRFLQLDLGDTSKTHNRMLIPADADHFRFDLWVDAAKPDSELVVYLDDDPALKLTSILLNNETSTFVPQRAAIPKSLRGKVHTLTFAIDDAGSGTPQVNIDNVRFSVAVDADDFGVHVDNQIVLTLAGGNLVATVDGVTVLNTALAGLTDGLTINGQTGNDTLVIDFSNGNPLPPGGLTFHGGEGCDTLQVVHGSFTDIIKTFTGPHDGMIQLDALPLITYTGLEPVDFIGDRVTNLTIDLPAGADNAVVEEAGVAGDGLWRIRSTDSPITFEQTIFPSPSGSLTINANGGDTVAVMAFDSLFNTPNIMLGGSGGGNRFVLGADERLPDAAALTLIGDAELDLSGLNETIGSLSDPAGGTRVSLGAGTLVAGGNHASTIYAGSVTGTGELIKTGAGVFRLSGTVGVGAATVEAGTLLVNGTLSATQDVQVHSSGTLGGTGTIAASVGVLVSPGGTLDPGDLEPDTNAPLPGGLTVNGDVTLQAGAVFRVQLGGLAAGVDYDQLRVNGAVDLAGLLNGNGGAVLDASLSFAPRWGSL